ncbi:hypothetical protein BT96DRAFT_947134 [Gymnopus androsaceus JB14]|uniref:Uncharacterized protein n=1 Tax=Gymnopus androsaceus JB14 TaxID=1447944 RepID=A0A6A4GVG1_9AGAR|nr:hypothetical protein BT96DRAFT_947134 [Gymnopus androsaceus JB14]
MNEDDEQKDMIVVAHQGNGLQVVYPSINGNESDIEATLDSSSQIVAIDRVIATGLNISWDPSFTIQMQDIHGGIQQTLGLAKNVSFKFESEIKNWGNGDQELTITDPNIGERCTVGTHPKGICPRQMRIDTSRYNMPIKQPQEQDKETSKGENGEEHELAISFHFNEQSEVIIEGWKKAEGVCFSEPELAEAYTMACSEHLKKWHPEDMQAIRNYLNHECMERRTNA